MANFISKGQPLTALFPLLSAVEGMVEVASSHWKEWQKREGVVLTERGEQRVKRMIDGALQHLSFEGVVRWQCQEWKQEALIPHQL